MTIDEFLNLLNIPGDFDLKFGIDDQVYAVDKIEVDVENKIIILK